MKIDQLKYLRKKLFDIKNTTEAQDDHKLRWFDVDNGVVIDVSPAYEFPTFKFNVLVEDKLVTGITCNDDDDTVLKQVKRTWLKQMIHGTRSRKTAQRISSLPGIAKL